MLDQNKQAVRTAVDDFAKKGDPLVLGLIALFALLTAICPFALLLYRFQADYGEGWCAYNTLTVAHHLPLYGTKYGWTMVNYPAFFFILIAHLSGTSANYPWAGRLVSLVSFALCTALVGAIIRRLTTGIAPALFGVSFCAALFCSQAPLRIVNNEPNMIAAVFFLGGFLLYLSKRASLSFGWIFAIVSLFMIGGNFKHSYIAYPLAVFLDLCMVSRRKAAQYLAIAAAWIGLMIAGYIHYEGPFFVANMTAPKALNLSNIDFPLGFILPITVSFFWAIRLGRIGRAGTRPLVILFFTALVVDFVLSTGDGEAVNIFFGLFFATSILMGVLLDEIWKGGASRSGFPGLWWRWGLPLAVTSSLVVSFFLSGQFHILRNFNEMRLKQERFATEVAFLRDHPGDAVCESLLRCYDAGKPDVYDPFEATRLIRFHKLNPAPMLAAIDAHQYSAIQLNGRVESKERPDERFSDPMLDAIQRDYVLALDDPGCAIYVPKT